MAISFTEHSLPPTIDLRLYFCPKFINPKSRVSIALSASELTGNVLIFCFFLYKLKSVGKAYKLEANQLKQSVQNVRVNWRTPFFARNHCIWCAHSASKKTNVWNTTKNWLNLRYFWAWVIKILFCCLVILLVCSLLIEILDVLWSFLIFWIQDIRSYSCSWL